jgi:hypothetical protein
MEFEICESAVAVLNSPAPTAANASLNFLTNCPTRFPAASDPVFPIASLIALNAFIFYNFLVTKR